MLTADLIRPRLQWEGKTLSVKMVDEQDTSALQTAHTSHLASKYG